MNPEFNHKLRAILLERYGLDVQEARPFYSTQNYAFIFPGHPHMIRVSVGPRKTRAEVLSELMWVDDLKQFKQTVCEPSPSLQGNLLEEFELDGVTCRASMFRTARGSVEPSASMTPMFFICVGDLLGAIHHVSTNERELGIAFRRQSLSAQFAERLARVEHRLDPALAERIRSVQRQVDAMPRDLGLYGLCHGDFHANNFFVEYNNVWLFDFDSCCYAPYLYDVACFVLSVFMGGYQAGRDCRATLAQDVLPYLKMGYELNHRVDASFWDQLEVMLVYRSAYALLALEETEQSGMMDLEQARQFFRVLLGQSDLLAALTGMLGASARREANA